MKKLNEQSDGSASDGFLPGNRVFENSDAGESWPLVKPYISICNCNNLYKNKQTLYQVPFGIKNNN